MASYFTRKTPNRYDQPEFLPCETIGGIVDNIQISNHKDHKITFDEKKDGLMYLRDSGIRTYGDCYFKISELFKKDKKMYELVRTYELNK